MDLGQPGADYDSAPSDPEQNDADNFDTMTRMEELYASVERFHQMEGIEGREKNELMEKSMQEFICDLLDFDTGTLYAAFLNLFHRFYVLETPQGEARGPPGTVAILWFNLFDKSVFEEAGELDRDNVLACRSVDKDQVRGALRILMSYKAKKYLVSIERVFQLREPDMEDVLVGHVKAMFDKQNFAKAMTWILHFNLHIHFSLDEVICYAHVKNETTLMDEFVGEDEGRREYCVRYLDMFLGLVVHEKRPDVRKRREQLKAYERDFWDTFVPYEPGKGRRTSALQGSTKKRLEQYGLPESIAPNLVNIRCINGLKHHYYKYLKKESDQQQFDDTVRQAITGNPVVRDSFLTLCCREKEYALALRCVYLLDIPREDWPDELSTWAYTSSTAARIIKQQVKELIERRRQRLEQQAEHKRTELFDDLPILMVDTTESLVALTAELREMPENLVLGVDTEFKQAWSQLSEQIALIQISDGQQVWLVDTVTLEEQQVTEQQWTEFFDVLFCTDILKTGYDFRNDLRVLLSTFPYIKPTLEAGMKNFVDLYRMLENVQFLPAFIRAIFGNEGLPSGKNLKTYAQAISGVPLEKTEQTSNWASRPLRLEQKKYAALDAYALVKLYYDICQRMQAAGLVDTPDAANLESIAKIDLHVLHRAIKVLPNPPPMKREEAGDLMEVVKRAQEQPVEYQQPRPPPRTVKEVKFIVDSMAHGLGHKLRRCGFFVVLEQNRKLIINTCRVDPSFVAISCGKGYREIVQGVGAQQVFDVPASTQTSMDRLLEYTIQQLNLVVRPEDIFSRCSSCNGDCFVLVPAPALKALYVIKMVRKEYEHFTADMIPPAVEELQRARPEDYEGHRCEATVSATGIIVQCDNGQVDVTSGLVLYDDRDAPVPVKFDFNLHNVYDRPGLVFYVCADCGKSFYEGSHRGRVRLPENLTVDGAEASTSSAAAGGE